jgi:hypothetical protein
MDRTTEGYEAEPEEVEALLHTLCGYHLAERDPLFRYQVLTREQVLYDALVATIKRERGRALAELVSGRTLKQVAEMANLGTRQRVARLIAIAKAAEEAAAEVQAASLAFDEQLAASELAASELAASEPTASKAAFLDPGIGDEMAGVADVPSVDVLMAAGGVPIVPGLAGAMSAFPAEPGDIGDSAADTDVAVEGAAEEHAAEDEAAAGDLDGPVDLGTLLGPTLLMPTLTAVLHPTREMPSPEDDEVAWWRQHDTGAA